MCLKVQIEVPECILQLTDSDFDGNIMKLKKSLNFFDNFTFMADLEFIFHPKKSAEIFQCPLFCH